MNTPPTCDTCKHAHPVIEDITIDGIARATPTVQCRRYPPALDVILAADSWCSEYDRKTGAP